MIGILLRYLTDISGCDAMDIETDLENRSPVNLTPTTVVDAAFEKLPPRASDDLKNRFRITHKDGRHKRYMTSLDEVDRIRSEDYIIVTTLRSQRNIPQFIYNAKEYTLDKIIATTSRQQGHEYQRGKTNWLFDRETPISGFEQVILHIQGRVNFDRWRVNILVYKLCETTVCPLSNEVYHDFVPENVLNSSSSSVWLVPPETKQGILTLKLFPPALVSLIAIKNHNSDAVQVRGTSDKGKTIDFNRISASTVVWLFENICRNERMRHLSIIVKNGSPEAVPYGLTNIFVEFKKTMMKGTEKHVTTTAETTPKARPVIIEKDSALGSTANLEIINVQKRIHLNDSGDVPMKRPHLEKVSQQKIPLSPRQNQICPTFNIKKVMVEDIDIIDVVGKRFNIPDSEDKVHFTGMVKSIGGQIVELKNKRFPDCDYYIGTSEMTPETNIIQKDEFLKSHVKQIFPQILMRLAECRIIPNIDM